MRSVINVALINPPLQGHQYRGTGMYTSSLYLALKDIAGIKVSLVEFGSDLSRYDIVHYPYFDPFFLTFPIISKKPTVVTIHDLIPFKFPKYFPVGMKGRVVWNLQKLFLRKAQAVITDSYTSKKDIIRFTGLAAEKVIPIYLGVDDEFKIIEDKYKLSQFKAKLKLPENFILYIGDVNYNKNISHLIQAFSLIREKLTDLFLVMVGKGFITLSPQLREIDKITQSLKLKDYIKLYDHLSKDDLVKLYNLAKVYVQPSLYEGFGLPVLEAMSCGIPVVSSKGGSLSEITNDSVIEIDPLDHKDISQKIISIIDNQNLRKEFISRGLKWKSRFTWKKTAEQTAEVYRKTIK